MVERRRLVEISGTLILASCVAALGQSSLGILETCGAGGEASCPGASPPQDYGCPGYVPVPLEVPKGEEGRLLMRDKAISLAAAKCDPERLAAGLMTEVESAIARGLDAPRFAVAQSLLLELEEARKANERIGRFHREWIRTGPSDSDIARDTIASMLAAVLRGDLQGATKTALDASTAPTVLGRSDFPYWYSAEQFARDRSMLNRLQQAQQRVWELSQGASAESRRP